MSRRPFQVVRVWSIQNRATHANVASPWVVRWVVDGARFSRSFRTKALAERFRSLLSRAVQDGDEFDTRSGEPVSWAPRPDELQVHGWVREWLAQEWQDWAPRSRASAVDAMVRFVPLVVDPQAPDAPKGLRRHLMVTLPPGGEGDDEIERWLDRWVLRLGDLDRTVLADVDRKLGIGDRGSRMRRRWRLAIGSCRRRASVGRWSWVGSRWIRGRRLLAAGAVGRRCGNGMRWM